MSCSDVYMSRLVNFVVITTDDRQNRLPYSGNFRGVQFSQIVDLYLFAGLIFVDVPIHAHYVLYKQTYFAGLIFVVRHSSAKTTKIGHLKISHYTVLYPLHMHVG